MRGLLPPFLGADAVTPERSPYLSTMPQLVASLGTSGHRRQLIRHLIDYRALLADHGYVAGVQFVDGSFVENVEQSAGRPPVDIDVFSILRLPDQYRVDPSAWNPGGLSFWENEVANRAKNKQRFSLDTYGMILDGVGPMQIIRDLIYWYGLFSHQRDTFAWKGFVMVALDPTADQAARSALEGR